MTTSTSAGEDEDTEENLSSAAAALGKFERLDEESAAMRSAVRGGSVGSGGGGGHLDDDGDFEDAADGEVSKPKDPANADFFGGGASGGGGGGRPSTPDFVTTSTDSTYVLTSVAEKEVGSRGVSREDGNEYRDAGSGDEDDDGLLSSFGATKASMSTEEVSSYSGGLMRRRRPAIPADSLDE